MKKLVVRRFALVISPLVIATTFLAIGCGRTDERPKAPFQPPRPQTPVTPPPAPSAYNLANSLLPKGTVLRSEARTSLIDGTVVYSVQNRAISGTVNSDSAEITETEILEGTAKEPTKMRMTFVADEETSKITIPNEPDQTITDPGPFHQRSILLQKVAGVWKATLEGSSPDPAQARLLQSDWPTDDFYPDRMLSIGESWTVSGAPLRKLAGFTDTLSFQGTAHFTLERVVMRNNDKCAVIGVQMDIKASALNEQNQDIVTELSLSGRIHRSLTSLIDVEGEMSGPRKLTTTTLIENQYVRISLNGPVTMKSSQTTFAAVAR